ncbi:MAG: hypothetical protein U1C46_08975, partial [Bacteroidales bacterium]|nr:hypothetical protein [Bacteroidales bacterium]
MKKTYLFASIIIGMLCINIVNAQWQQTGGPEGGHIYSLATDGTNIFAGTVDGIYLSTNNGNSWTAVNNGLTNPHVYAIAISGNNIFAGTPANVYLSTNNGNSWTAVNTGLPNAYIYALAISGNNIF